jgi:general secretion pathway protein F
MPTFRYSGYDAVGTGVSGTVEAETLRDAVDRLKRDGLFPKELVPDEEGTGRRRLWSFGSRVRLPELSLMTRRLAVLAGSAVPIFEAVTTLQEQERPGELKKALGRVRERLAGGASLARALEEEPTIFGESYTSMVAAGEASGALEPILNRLADFLEDQEEIRTRVTGALAYPALMVAVGILVVMFLLGTVIPKIAVIFEQNKAALPLITVIVIKTSTLIRKGWWILVLLTAGAIFAYRKGTRKESFLCRRDSLLLSLPLSGPLLRSLVLSRLAKVLGLLLGSGVPIIRAMEITAEAVVNRTYRDFLLKARQELAEGGSLSASLRNSPLFPPLLVHMVSVGEKGGRLEEMLSKAGTAYEKEFASSVSRMTALLEPFLVLAMGVAVGILVLSVLLPIFQLNQLVR